MAVSGRSVDLFPRTGGAGFWAWTSLAPFSWPSVLPDREEMEAAPDTETFLKLDHTFHLTSYQDTGMKQLLAMIERFWNTTQRYRRAFTTLLGRERTWIIHAEHRLIADSIRRRDADGAASLLAEHIRRTKCELAQHADLFPPTPVKARRKRAD